MRHCLLLRREIRGGASNAKLCPEIEMDDPLRYLVSLAIDEHILVGDPAFLGFLVYDFD